MAFKMKGWSGSPAKKTYKEAYKSRDMKTYGSMSEAEYIAEAKRQNKSYKETGKWDAPKKVSTPKITTPKASKPMSVKAPERAVVRPTKMEATGKIKRQDKRRARKAKRRSKK